MIVSTLAQPGEMIADLSMVDLGYLQHGDEAEVILTPGQKLVRVHSLFNREGPIDLSRLADDDAF
jgi:hypothetical protein